MPNKIYPWIDEEKVGSVFPEEYGDFLAKVYWPCIFLISEETCGRSFKERAIIKAEEEKAKHKIESMLFDEGKSMADHEGLPPFPYEKLKEEMDQLLLFQRAVKHDHFTTRLHHIRYFICDSMDEKCQACVYWPDASAVLATEIQKLRRLSIRCETALENKQNEIERALSLVMKEFDDIKAELRGAPVETDYALLSAFINALWVNQNDYHAIYQWFLRKLSVLTDELIYQAEHVFDSADQTDPASHIRYTNRHFQGKWHMPNLPVFAEPDLIPEEKHRRFYRALSNTESKLGVIKLKKYMLSSDFVTSNSYVARNLGAIALQVEYPQTGSLFKTRPNVPAVRLRKKTDAPFCRLVEEGDRIRAAAAEGSEELFALYRAYWTLRCSAEGMLFPRAIHQRSTMRFLDEVRAQLDDALRLWNPATASLPIAVSLRSGRQTQDIAETTTLNGNWLTEWLRPTEGGGAMSLCFRNTKAPENGTYLWHIKPPKGFLPLTITYAADAYIFSVHMQNAEGALYDDDIPTVEILKCIL